MTKIEAYKKILKTINSVNKEIGEFDSEVMSFLQQLTHLITREEIQEASGISLRDCHQYSDNSIRLRKEDCWIIKFGKKYNRSIGCSDNGKQPKEGEWLFSVSYPTGAYYFGVYFYDYYPTELFNKFFEELKSFEPKYVDTVNHSVYYSLDKVKAVYEALPELEKKYKQLAKEARKDEEVATLKQKLKELEGT